MKVRRETPKKRTAEGTFMRALIFKKLQTLSLSLFVFFSPDLLFVLFCPPYSFLPFLTPLPSFFFLLPLFFPLAATGPSL